jgi:anti-anti-sigma factor
MTLPHGGHTDVPALGPHRRPPTMRQWRGSVRDPDHSLAGGLTVTPTRPRSGLVLLRVIGEVDMLTARQLADALDGAITDLGEEQGATTPDGEGPAVVCDLGGVTFFGASGLDVVATAQQSALARHVRLVLVAGHRTVLRPLRLTALDRRVTLTDTHPALGRTAAVPGEEHR